MKKYLTLLIALSFLIAGGACTRELYSDWNTFDEEVSTFLITEDGKQLVVTGKKYRNYSA